jgi:hypothetical protein
MAMAETRKTAGLLVSLSAMTAPSLVHMLLEQIYRAVTIMVNHPITGLSRTSKPHFGQVYFLTDCSDEDFTKMENQCLWLPPRCISSPDASAQTPLPPKK